MLISKIIFDHLKKKQKRITKGRKIENELKSKKKKKYSKKKMCNLKENYIWRFFISILGHGENVRIEFLKVWYNEIIIWFIFFIIWF